MTRLSMSMAILLAMCPMALAELDTITYLDSQNGAPNNGGFVNAGRVEGDTTGVGEVTLFDIKGGDFWNGGDQGTYVHQGEQLTGNWTATVRVVSQTAAVDGRWGKAGIQARNDLDPNAANAMAQLAAGNGSQVDTPPAGDHSPVPVRISGRTTNDGQNGFETGIPAASGTEQDVDSDGNIANNTFQTAGTVPTWLSLSYNSTNNEFIAGTAMDVAGSPGVWSYSPPVTDVPSDGDGWYVGLAYSMHNDMVPVDADNMHGVTFDNFSLAVPEPSTIGLLLISAVGLIAVVRRRR